MDGTPHLHSVRAQRTRASSRATCWDGRTRIVTSGQCAEAGAVVPDLVALRSGHAGVWTRTRTALLWGGTTFLGEWDTFMKSTQPGIKHWFDKVVHGLGGPGRHGITGSGRGTFAGRAQRRMLCAGKWGCTPPRKRASERCWTDGFVRDVCPGFRGGQA
jgi:hypothetical protein